jgi:hypothetical protein
VLLLDLLLKNIIRVEWKVSYYAVMFLLLNVSVMRDIFFLFLKNKEERRGVIGYWEVN